MAAIQIASVRPDQEHLRASAIRARLAGIPVVLAIGLIPSLGAAWTMVLVTAVCTAEVLSDLFAANPEILTVMAESVRVDGES
jgi:hypothetical protein